MRAFKVRLQPIAVDDLDEAYKNVAKHALILRKSG